MPPALSETPPAPGYGSKISFDIEKLPPVNNALQRLKFTSTLKRTDVLCKHGATFDIVRNRGLASEVTLFSIVLPACEQTHGAIAVDYKFTSVTALELKAADAFSIRRTVTNAAGGKELPAWKDYDPANVKLRGSK